MIDLVAIARAALARWPWIDGIEASRGLPPRLLLAVGLRETGLRDITGDGGHGHGPWQLDDRTPGRTEMIRRIDAGDVRYAAEVAADMLHSRIVRYRGVLLSALNDYNSGQPLTRYTAHGDYGPSVLNALTVLQLAMPSGHPPDGPPPTGLLGPVLVYRAHLGGKPVALIDVPIPTGADGDGSAPVPGTFLAVSSAGSHDKFDPNTRDTDTLVVPVGSRRSGGGHRVVVEKGPANTQVVAEVLVAD